MTTSRSGTATHKRMRAKILAHAIENGILNCPTCGVELDFNVSRRPNSPEADEITPYVVRGYTSTNLEDWQVLCRQCNQRKGARLGNARKRVVAAKRMRVSPVW